jgi:hypothetical protein
MLLKNKINFLELISIGFVIYLIGIDYNGNFSSYRFNWDWQYFINTRLIIDLLLLCLFLTRVIQILKMIFKVNFNYEIKLQIIAIFYLVLILPDLYSYAMWIYYLNFDFPWLQIIILILPLILWINYIQKTRKITSAG